MLKAKKHENLVCSFILNRVIFLLFSVSVLRQENVSRFISPTPSTLACQEQPGYVNRIFRKSLSCIPIENDGGIEIFSDSFNFNSTSGYSVIMWNAAKCFLGMYQFLTILLFPCDSVNAYWKYRFSSGTR